MDRKGHIHKIRNKMKQRNIMYGVVLTALILILAIKVYAVPVGPSVSELGNSSLGDAPNATVNMTGNTTTAGGYIYTINLQTRQQNARWKGYVGNVTGTLVLSDSSGYFLYDWPMTTALSGEVYATRSSTLVSWASIACANTTHIYNESIDLNFTGYGNDNLTATFNAQDNEQFDVGTVSIGAATCWTTNMNVNSTDPTDDAFEEVMLYDGGSDPQAGDIVFAAIVEDSASGYKNTTTGYDFQMILPEIAYPTWTGATAYYFYVELA